MFFRYLFLRLNLTQTNKQLSFLFCANKHTHLPHFLCVWLLPQRVQKTNIISGVVGGRQQKMTQNIFLLFLFCPKPFKFEFSFILPKPHTHSCTCRAFHFAFGAIGDELLRAHVPVWLGAGTSGKRRKQINQTILGKAQITDRLFDLFVFVFL